MKIFGTASTEFYRDIIESPEQYIYMTLSGNELIATINNHTQVCATIDPIFADMLRKKNYKLKSWKIHDRRKIELNFVRA